MPPHLDDFHGLAPRIGTVRTARLNPAARVAALVLEVDFGPLGVKTTSAQLTGNYDAAGLIGRQVVALTNLPVRTIAGVRSEVLVLAGVDADGAGTVLLQPDRPLPDGTPVA